MDRPTKITVIEKNDGYEIICMDEMSGSSIGVDLPINGYKALAEHFRTGAMEISSDELGNCNKPHVMPMLLCIDTGDWIWLEKDNTYHALFEYEDKYIIIDDEGDIIAAEKELFKIIGYKSN